MRVMSSYRARIKHYNHIFDKTTEICAAAVIFFADVAKENWDEFKDLNSYDSLKHMEELTVETKKRPVVPHPFGSERKEFYKFPCYLRRSLIIQAIGMVSSYKSNLERWEQMDHRSRGKRPSMPSVRHIYPSLYRDNMYRDGEGYTAYIKVYIRNTWDWLKVDLRKSDVDYLSHHCMEFESDAGPLKSRRICAPSLIKSGKKWYLSFPIEEMVEPGSKSVYGQTIVSVDLGINNACVCSVMTSDGTVKGREFLRLPEENDCLVRAIGHLKKAQMHGARRMPGLWAAANGINDHIAVKTASFIIDTAMKYSADVIVMEYLDVNGKKHGSRKQRLHMWKCRYVQGMVLHKAHRLGMRVSRVCAWNTSRLAFDGSGRVKRGDESRRTKGNYNICEFSSGKLYHCDLNASYNIGSRYFVREIIKSLPVTAGQRLEAKVPAVRHRSTCTLSILIELNAVLQAAA